MSGYPIKLTSIIRENNRFRVVLTVGARETFNVDFWFDSRVPETSLLLLARNCFHNLTRELGEQTKDWALSDEAKAELEQPSGNPPKDQPT